MQQVTLEEAQLHLAEIIARLPPGTEVVIVDGNKPVATIRSAGLVRQPMERILGTLQGSVTFVGADFDASPEGFDDFVG